MKMRRGLCEVGTAFLNMRSILVSKGVGSCGVDQQIEINQNFLALRTSKWSRSQ